MGIVEKWEYMRLDMEDDPDYYRPDSELAVIVDLRNLQVITFWDSLYFKKRLHPEI